MGFISKILGKFKTNSKKNINRTKESNLNSYMPTNKNSNFYKEASIDELNSAYLKLGPSNRRDMIFNVLSDRLGIEDFLLKDSIVNRLCLVSEPFSSDLFKSLLNQED